MVRLSLSLTLAGLMVLAGLPLIAESPQAEPAQTESVWEEIRKLYERAKDAGEQVPADVADWVKQDVQAIGDWEYRVVALPTADAAKLEQRLNEMGKNRWDCFWVHTTGGETAFMFKRPRRTYLKNVPLSDLLKLIPREEN